MMSNFLYSWRYYTFGRDKYEETIGNLFSNNLVSLCKTNTAIAIFVGAFSIYPVISERNFLSAGIYLLSALIALLLAIYSNYKMQKQSDNNRFIYAIIIAYYANIMLFGLYLSVWSSPDKPATIFLCFLICVLLMFINPPIFTFLLTFSSMLIFIVSTIILKNREDAILDILNVLIAGAFSLFFNWQITKLRLGLELSATMLEEERNKYFDQSTIDELTKLKNRRDFMQTFHRYISNYRTSDDWLCMAMCDIDFFKNFNDHYGHPAGDDCLRSVGKILGSLMESMGVYAARVGGEEFALLWFEQDASHVDAVVSHIMSSIAALKMPHEKSKVSKFVSISIGVYVERCGSPTDAQTLYDLADKMLYTAKESGRNRAVICGESIKEYKITPDA
jgi:diguanylate cyclase (GGDEF)-like protein